MTREEEEKLKNLRSVLVMNRNTIQAASNVPPEALSASVARYSKQIEEVDKQLKGIK